MGDGLGVLGSAYDVLDSDYHFPYPQPLNNFTTSTPTDGGNFDSFLASMAPSVSPSPHPLSVSGSFVDQLPLFHQGLLGILPANQDHLIHLDAQRFLDELTHQASIPGDNAGVALEPNWMDPATQHNHPVAAAQGSLELFDLETSPSFNISWSPVNASQTTNLSVGSNPVFATTTTSISTSGTETTSPTVRSSPPNQRSSTAPGRIVCHICHKPWDSRAELR